MSHALGHRFANRRGSALVTAAIVAGILAILVAGFLSYVTNEYGLNVRAQAWSQALHLCEAGVDLGLAEMNFPYRMQGPLYSFQSSAGWVANGSYSYTKTVTNITDATGASVGSFTLTVDQLNAKCPILTCTGTCTIARGPSLTRILKVIVTKPSAIRYELRAKSGMSQI